MIELLRRILCSLGLHKLSNPATDSFKSTGQYRGVEELVYQKGVSICTRNNCKSSRLLWRQGWTGGSKTCMGQWKSLNPSMQSQIDSLRDRQLM